MQVIITQNGRRETYGTYATSEEAERIAAGLRQVWWVAETTVEVRAR